LLLDLSPAHPNGQVVLGRCFQITVHVLPPVSAEVVTHASVELDDDPLAVVHEVPVDDAVARRLADLAATTRKAMSLLDLAEVRALEYRLDTSGGLEQDLTQP